MVVCYSVFRVQDLSSSFDEYITVANSTWNPHWSDSCPDCYSDGDARVFMDITSSAGSLDNEYRATGNYTSTTDCTHPVNVGVSYGSLTVSTPCSCSPGGGTGGGSAPARAEPALVRDSGDGTMRSGASWAGRWYTSGQFNLDPVADRLVVGDFTGDGKAEPALVRDDGDGTFTTWRWTSTGSSFVRTTDYHSGNFALSTVADRVASGDVDGDGDSDVVITYQNTDGTFSFYTFPNGSTTGGIWYRSGPFDLGPVGNRMILGAW